MTPAQIRVGSMRARAQLIALAIQARLATILWGEPGTGKSSLIRAIAKALGLPAETIIAAIREPSDFLGLPVIDRVQAGGRPVTLYAAPGWAERLAGQPGILFLDEISCAPPAVMAGLLRVILEKYVGELHLGDEVAMIAAANPAELAAGGYDLPAPAANRFLHIDWSVDPVEWVAWARQRFRLPDLPRVPATWASTLPVSESLVLAFLERRPSLAQACPATEAERGRAWPSVRTWYDGVARALAACDTARYADGSTVSEDIQALMIQGLVGDAAGGEFLDWRRELDLPNPDDLLANPTDFEVIERCDKAYAVLAAIVAAVSSQPTEARWKAAWAICKTQAKREKGLSAPAAGALLRLTKRYNGPLDLPIPADAKDYNDLMNAAQATGG